MKKLTLLFSLFCLTRLLFSQHPDSSVNRAGNLSLSLKSISFMRNNEYLNPVTEGYTMFGFFLQPAIVWSPGEKFSLTLGTHITGYAGDKSGVDPRLIFTSAWNITPRSRLIIGTLDGSDKHRMYDPLFHSEKLYTAYAENGIRVVNDFRHFFSDIWINWENFIRKGDTTREQFTGGISLRYTSEKTGNIFSVEVPVQVLMKHYGGQISNYNGVAESYLNVSAGLRLNADIAEGKAGRASVEYNRLIYTELTNWGNAGVSDGNASWLKLHYKFRWLEFITSYWKSHNFYAPNGNPIYSSVSDHQEGVIVPDRKIWGNALFLNLTPGGYFEFLAGFETWYDPGFKRFDNSFTVHLKFDRLFSLIDFR